MTAATPPPLTSGEIEELERLLGMIRPGQGFLAAPTMNAVQAILPLLPRLLSSLKGSAGKGNTSAAGAAPLLARDAIDGIVQQIVREVAELPDRTSPDEQPSMMLVHDHELTDIVANALGDALAGAAPRPSTAEASAAVEIAQRALASDDPWEAAVSMTADDVLTMARALSPKEPTDG